ncbi:MAG: ATP-binding protein [Syntrophaceae bacterium]|nr:ATP-binding protein [Syntrophaceae bacterium]
MTNEKYLNSLLCELCMLSKENEWIEFKHNRHDENEIGQYISALSNSALLNGKDKAYMVWGVDDKTHEVLGTGFSPMRKKIGNEELENWLLQRLSPKINFHFHEFQAGDNTVVILEISAASQHPTSFNHEEFIRIGSYCKKLKDFPEKERELWRLLDKTPFELFTAAEHLTKDKVFELLDYAAYFELLNLHVPDGHSAILETLFNDQLILKDDTGSYCITNLGAILFAKDLDNFPSLKYKAVRVVQYESNNKLKTIREKIGIKGYAVGFKNLIEYIVTLMTKEENLNSPIRKTITMFPTLAIRELVANALIHQDLFETGTRVMIELFDDRLEITNPGMPLVDINRFLDAPPKSRNEKLASLMRRLGICEERGSGFDKVVIEIEMNQLPAPIIETPGSFTRVILFAYRELKNLTKEDRMRACYYHACIKYVERDYMTNTSLRTRFGIDSKNGAMASRIINEAIQSELICIYDESVGAKARKYVPAWAKN